MPLDPVTTERLANTHTIDLTTTGRRSGRPHRVEIWWFHFEGRFVVTGTPGPRDWLANVRADPRVVVHVEGRDLDAFAEEIDDDAFRRRLFGTRAASWYRSQAGLDRLVESAPMVELRFP
jgi:deazaflavin-dependent oxidoreductase (nitroreductase family)